MVTAFCSSGSSGSTVCVVLSKRFVTHFNAGATVWHDARNESGERVGLDGFNLGHSLVWLARPALNVLFETVWTDTKTSSALYYGLVGLTGFEPATSWSRTKTFDATKGLFP